MNFVIVRYNDGNYTVHMDNDVNDSFALPESAIAYTHYLQDQEDEQGRKVHKTVMIGSLVKVFMGDLNYSVNNSEIGKEGVCIRYIMNGHYNFCATDENITIVNNYTELESNVTKEFMEDKKVK